MQDNNHSQEQNQVKVYGVFRRFNECFAEVSTTRFCTNNQIKPSIANLAIDYNQYLTLILKAYSDGFLLSADDSKATFQPMMVGGLA